MASARIGVFGGTFDPPHVGHLVAAVNVMAQLELDQVQFVVAEVPWQKVGTRAISKSSDRLAMVSSALVNRSTMIASAIEIERGGDSVTADTIEELRTHSPDAAFHVIVGSDAAAGLSTWRRAKALRDLANIVVVDRPGAEGHRPPVGFRFQVVPCPLMDVSSTEIRERARDGLPIDYLVPDPVRDYIESQGLYQ